MKALIPAAICAALATTSLSAQDHPAGTPPAAKPAPAAATKPATPKETFAIIKAGEDTKVVSATELATMQKKAAADHKKAMDDYAKAKKEAEAAKKPFTEKPPHAATITVEHGDFATKEAADAELAKMKAAKEAKDKEAKDKEKGKAGEKGKDAPAGGEKPKSGK